MKKRISSQANRAGSILCILALCCCQSLTIVAQESKPSPSPAGEKAKPVFAFVALRKLTVPTAQDVEKALKANLPDGTKIEDIQPDNKAITFSVDGQRAMIGLMDMPIPWGDLEGPCATCWHWKNATEEMKAQKAHVIVMLFSKKGTQIDQCILLTKLLSATTQMFDAIGIYWGHGSVVMNKEELQKSAATASKDDLPLMVWIEYRIQKNADGTVNVITTGLDYFGCMELEVINSKNKPTEILNMVMAVSSMTLNGELFKDGDTVGPDENTKIKTHYVKSVWDRPEKVLRIDM